MKTSRTAEVLPENVNSVRTLTENKVRFSPRLFKHRELFNDLGDAQKMALEDLNNLLNSIHFAGESLYALFHHPRYEENILVKAYPDPSLDETLTCRWADEQLPSSLPRPPVQQPCGPLLTSGPVMTPPHCHLPSGRAELDGLFEIDRLRM